MRKSLGLSFASQRRSTSKFESLVMNKNIVREEQQTRTSLQNQTEMATKPTQSFSDDHSSDIIFTNEGGAIRLFYYFFLILFFVLFVTLNFMI